MFLICFVLSSNGNIFGVTGHLCGEFTGHRWIPAQRPVRWSFDVFFDLRLNKRSSKQWWGWWFETISHSLWRHCNEFHVIYPYLRRLHQRHRDIFYNFWPDPPNVICKSICSLLTPCLPSTAKVPKLIEINWLHRLSDVYAVRDGRSWKAC